MNIEELRAEFEAWLYLDQTKYDPERMSKQEIEIAKLAYQAGRAALQSQDREDAERVDFLQKEWFWQNSQGCWIFSFNECWDAGQHDSLRAAIDHARRVEGEEE